MNDQGLCSIEGCDKKILNKSKALCSIHYQRMRRHGSTDALRIRGQKGKKCIIEDCAKEQYSKRLCVVHYNRNRIHGTTDIPSGRYKRRQKWIIDHSSHTGENCLTWPFYKSGNGRGLVRVDGKTYTAPRYMCIIAHGAPPSEEYQAAHSCGNGHLGCVNPMHLRWATRAENEFDKIEHGTQIRGVDVNTNKLTEDEVREIRGLAGEHSGASLAKKYNVTPAAISAILNRKNWAWLD